MYKLCPYIRTEFIKTINHSLVSRPSTLLMSTMSTVEVNIPTPWGHLSTKCWNVNTNNLPTIAHRNPVICLHGWQDNAGSFDHLIPLLTPEIPFICLDFAGHGKSSPRSAGATLDPHAHILDIKRVVDFFKLEHVNLMGHSMGGGLSLEFAGAFPDLVKKCVTFDAPAPFPCDPTGAPEQMARAVLKHLSYESNPREPPKYTYVEAMDRFLKGRQNNMKESSAKTLMKRGLLLVEEGGDLDQNLYVFSRDIRVTFPTLISLTPEQTKAFVEKVSCKLLVISFKDNYWESIEGMNGDTKKLEKLKQEKEDILKIYEKNCRYFHYLEVEGHHHTHLDFPDRLNNVINMFLGNDSKL